MLKSLCKLIHFSLLSIKSALLYCHLFYSLAYLMKQLLEVLVNFRQNFSDGLNIMALMLSMDHALRAYWWTVAGEAVIANWLLRMVCTRSQIGHLRPTKRAKTTSIAHVNVHLLLVIESTRV